MKKLITHLSKVILLLALTMSFSQAKAAPGEYSLSLQNLTQTTPFKLEFDVYLLNKDNTSDFYLSSQQLGILFKSEIYAGGAITVTIDNTNTELGPNQRFSSNQAVVDTHADFAGQSLIKLVGPIPPTAPGECTKISTSGLGTLMAHFVITNTVAFVANSRPNFIFTSNTVSSPFYATRVHRLVSGINNELPITPGVNATILDQAVLNPSIIKYNVTGGGSYCIGSVGLPVGLSNSETGVTYTLYKNGIAQVPTVPGNTGFPISFGDQLAGAYTVKGVNVAGIPEDMNLSATITENLLPQGSLSANGPICVTGTGLLTWTATTGTGPYSIVYKENDGVERTATGVVSGTPFTTFTGPVTSTTQYTLVSVTDANCTRTSNFTANSATIVVSQLPVMSSPASKTICSGSAIDIPLTSVVASSYTWVASANANVTGASLTPQTTNAINDVLVNTSNTVQTVEYTVTPTSNIGGCAGIPQTVTITIDPTTVGGTITGANTIVYGSPTGILTLAGQTGAVVKWQKKLDSGSWIDLANTELTLTDIPNSIGTWLYRAELKSGTCVTAYSNEFSIIVTTKELTIAGVTAVDKVYNAGLDCSLTGTAVLNGVVAGDVVLLSGTPVATFATSNVEVNAKPVTCIGYTILGAPISNYTLTQPTGLSAKITPKPLTVTKPTVVTNKMVDGNSSAVVTLKGSLQGVETSDVPNVGFDAVATYNSATPATGKTITVVYTLTGTANGNYSKPVDYVITGAKISDNITLTATATVGCEGSDFDLNYHLITGTPTQYKITFNAAAVTAGFKNVAFTNLPTTNSDGTFFLPIAKGTADGVYQGTLQMINELGALSPESPFQIQVNLSSDLIIDRFNDVVLFDNSSKRFATYQWYKNDVLINGAVKQAYSDPDGLVGSYSVKVTTTDGKTLVSCHKTLNIPLNKKVIAYPNPLKVSQECAVKVTGFKDSELEDAELVIFNTQGVPVYQSQKVEQTNLINLPASYGVFIGQVTTATGTKYMFKIIVEK